MDSILASLFMPTVFVLIFLGAAWAGPRLRQGDRHALGLYSGLAFSALFLAEFLTGDPGAALLKAALVTPMLAAGAWVLGRDRSPDRDA